MIVSRLRMRLTVRFGVAFLIGLAALDATLFVYRHREADRRLTNEMTAVANGLVAAMERENGKAHTSLRQAAAEVFDSWPDGPEAIAVFAPQDGMLVARGPTGLVDLITAEPRAHNPAPVWELPLTDGTHERFVQAQSTTDVQFQVVVARSTADLERYYEVLAEWLAISVPVVLMIALVSGYILARGALRPLEELTQAIGGMAPHDLDRRLPVRSPPDELDDLTDQFNSLLARLADAQLRSRNFLAQAAHQLKTPLTIVRGESALGLDRPRDPDQDRLTLSRIRRAADQMTHRVDDLFLMAQAEADQQPPLQDRVELDRLAFECADLMRGRAMSARHALEFGRIEPAEAMGNEALLREALLELIENGLRHGTSEAPVRVSAYGNGVDVYLEVSSNGTQLEAAQWSPPTQKPATGTGLGMSIVHWIAAAHAGRLRYSHGDGKNTFRIEWPAAGTSTTSATE